MKKAAIHLIICIVFLSSCFPWAGRGWAEEIAVIQKTAAKAPVEVADEPGKVSLDLKGMDVVEVIKMLAVKGNLNIVFGNDVKGRVTIFLKSVNLMDAFDIVLVASDLAYDKRGDIIYVMSQREYEDTYGERYADKKQTKIFQLKYAKADDVAKALTQMKTKIGKIVVDEGSNTVVVIDSPAFIAQLGDTVERLDSPTVTKVFSLTYAKAADVKTKISESLTKGVGTMQVDERTNKIVVTDLEKKMDEIQRMISAFDERLKQVFIESKIVQITLNDKYKLGVDWTSIFKKVNLKGAFGVADKNTLTPGAQVAVGNGDANADYNVVVQALKTVGDANLLSSPRITVLSDQEAKILVGRTQPYAINTVTQGTSTTTTATNLQFIDIGVKLYVTPTVNRDGFITMKIKPEVSSATENYTYGNPATTVPIVETTQAETSVTVKDGTTIVIAGLIKDERKNSVDKIPLLGDIPIIKEAFRKTSKEVTKQELVVFLTPHIVSGDNDYLEAPQTPPTGDKKFTVPEALVFEKRQPVEMNPSLYMNDKSVKQKQTAQKSQDTEMVVSKTVVPARPEEYDYVVKERIADHVVAVKGKKGAVKVQFFLTQAGAVAYAPEIVSSTDHALDEAAINAVVKAAPYPANPDTANKAEKRFIIDIAFE